MGTAQQPRAVVLVVEDEPLLRMYAVSIVEDAGLEAIEASNADQAIAILERNANIRIIFTDIDMPGSMDGLKLAKAVRNRWPPVEIILTSGHVRVEHSDIPERGRFFPKPYNADDITHALHQLSGGS
jgi:CheY-like chemotaxis protein